MARMKKIKITACVIALLALWLLANQMAWQDEQMDLAYHCDMVAGGWWPADDEINCNEGEGNE